MTHFNRQYLINFYEKEVNFSNHSYVGLVVLVRIPTSTYTLQPTDQPHEIHRVAILEALHQSTEVFVPLYNISR